MSSRSSVCVPLQVLDGVFFDDGELPILASSSIYFQVRKLWWSVLSVGLCIHDGCVSKVRVAHISNIIHRYTILPVVHTGGKRSMCASTGTGRRSHAGSMLSRIHRTGTRYDTPATVSFIIYSHWKNTSSSHEYITSKLRFKLFLFCYCFL